MIRNYNLQKAAAQFRSQNGFGSNEPIRLRSWLQKLNVLTVFKDLSPSFCGMALKQNEHKFILVNSAHSLGKQHFTIGHELYHLFIQEDFTSMVCSTGSFNKKNRVEYEADWFASFLLLPADGVLELIPESEMGKNKISMSSIVKIEQYYACSRIALLFRLTEMGLIDFEDYRHCTTSVIKSAESYGFDTSLYKKGNQNLIIGDYGAKAKDLYESDKISESHYASLMMDIGIDLSIENISENEAVL